MFVCVVNCLQAEAGTGAQFECVLDEPAPIVLSEVAHDPQLPAVVRYMVESRTYMRVMSHGGLSLFFAPVLRGNGHAVDYSRL